MNGNGCSAVHHGTDYAYKRYGCRCPEAIAAHSKHRGRRTRVGTRGTLGVRLHRDIDEIAVDLAVRGERTTSGGKPKLGIEERRIAILELTRRGKSINQICDQLGVSHFTVSRYRKLAGEVAA